MVRKCLSCEADLMDCSHFGCVHVMRASALVFRPAYYPYWILHESLFLVAGLGLELDQDTDTETVDRLLRETDIWILETANMISVFTWTWNKNTAQWLRRLTFQRNTSSPLLATFTFSACWHGLHPGQVCGFLCWAVMVEADYRFHSLGGSMAKSLLQRRLYRALTWCHTQFVVAYIMTTIEMRRLSMLWYLSASYNSFFPLVYFIFLLLLAKRRRSKPTSPHSHI